MTDVLNTVLTWWRPRGARVGKAVALAAVLGLVTPFAVAATDAVAQPAIVIVIDDVGDNLGRGQAAVALPGPVTYAFLPHTPHSKRLATLAYNTGKDVILHAPMENTHELALGPGALTRKLAQTEFAQVLRHDLDAIPHALGLNNHMGSLLTTLEPQMQWVMDEIEQRGLFFIDSGTTANTLAWRVARQRGVPYLRRDVFLDHEQTTEFVAQQFEQTIAIARKYGSAVAIGHPYPVTVDYLRNALPRLDEMGIRLVSASALLRERDDNQRRRAYYQRQQVRAQKMLTLIGCDEDAPASCREPGAAESRTTQKPLAPL